MVGGWVCYPKGGNYGNSVRCLLRDWCVYRSKDGSMLILVIGLVFLALIFNVVFYEYRVRKSTKSPEVLDLTGVRFK